MSKRKSKETGGAAPAKKRNLGPAWQVGLLKALDDKSTQLFADDRVVVIDDAYKKAKYHMLVIARKDIDRISDVTESDLDLIEHMDKVGRDMAKKRATDDSVIFQFGFHSVPSMRRLHLHVISRDFDSPQLKTKKHWNSFNTPFFIDSSSALKQLREDGKVSVDPSASQQLLQPMRCQHCHLECKTIPSLKAHIVQCSSKKNTRKKE